MKYLVMAYRYGTNEYSFPVGIFSTWEEAENNALSHRLFRGNKYDHQIFEITEGEMYDAEEARHYWVTGDKKGETK